MKEGYKDTPIGLIPEDWDAIKVKEFATVVTGNTPPTDDPENFGDKYLWVTPTDISGKKDIKVTQRKLSQKGYEISRPLNPNSLLVTCIASIGKNAIIREQACCNQQINAILPSVRHNTDFLYYLFEKEKQKLLQLAGQTAVMIINKSVFENHQIALPPVSEQNRIADILSSVDDKIDVINERITQTQQLKNGLMQQLLTRGIGHTKFKDSLLGEIPESWVVKRLGDVANVNMGQSPSSDSYNENGDGLYLVQGNADIKNRRTSPRIWTSEITKECAVGDIIMTVRAPVGAVARSFHRACIGRGVCAINSKSIDINFLYYYLIDYGSKWGSLEQGSTFTAVNGKDILGIKIPFPPSEEQSKIASIFSTADEKLDAQQEKKSEYEKLKAGLMQQLLTGNIRVKV